MHWESDGQVRNIPAVLPLRVGEPAGRFGIVLANWTHEAQSISIADARLGKQVLPTVSTEEVSTRARVANNGKLALTLSPLSCMLVERA